MNIPLLTVIVPAYNEGEYITSTLKAIKNQDYPRIEILVVDNNSQDNTAEIVKKLSIPVISEKKQGISHARQRGFLHADGEIVAKVDADTILPRDWASRVMNAFHTDANLVGLSGLPEYGDRGKLYQIVSRYAFLLTIYSIRLLYGHFQLVGSNYAVRKSALQHISPHLDDRQVHEDIDLSCHIKKSGDIAFLSGLRVNSSARRITNNPGELFEYTVRTFRTYFLHHPSHKRHSV